MIMTSLLVLLRVPDLRVRGIDVQIVFFSGHGLVNIL